MATPEKTADRALDTSILTPLEAPPSRAQVVIVGGGIIGASIAKALADRNWTDVVVIERGRLTSGTTWHAAGLVLQLRPTRALSELCVGNAGAYEQASSESGIDVGLRRVGSMVVARTPARMREYQRGLSVARDVGVRAVSLSAPEVREMWPAVEVNDLEGGVYFPDDATVNPGDAALALAKSARDRGVGFVEGTSVTGFRLAGNRITHVETSEGVLESEYVVLAAGLWTGELARQIDLSLALYPAEHVWVVSDPRPTVHENMPTLRDLDGYFYLRGYRGAYMVGAFEPDGRPRAPTDIEAGRYTEFGPDWKHIAPILANAMDRLPDLRQAHFDQYMRAPESFTPDTNPLLGATPEVDGLFVAAGMNSAGISYAPGAGRAVAEWITEGRPTRDLTDVDVTRFGSWANQRSWLHERTTESLGRLYALHWPGLQPSVARGVRRLPLDEKLGAAGASFGEIAGWERPAWYQVSGQRPPRWKYDLDCPSWFPDMKQEMLATREAVSFFDLSSYAKFTVQGRDVVLDLQRLCAGEMDIPAGRVVYTTICNEFGGIELDPTFTRIDQDIFMAIGATDAQRRLEALLRNGLGSKTTVTDMTSGLATLHIAGPRSRDLLSCLTDADLSNEAFPFLSAREIELGWTKAWAVRLSYTGELGWELYVPTEFASALYDVIVKAGPEFGLRHAGAFAFEALGLERGFRAWGHDVTSVDDPFASGLGFTVPSDKESWFVGSDRLASLRYGPRFRRLVSTRLEDGKGVLWGGEAVLRDGQRVGHVARGAFGFSLGASVGLAWLTRPTAGIDIEWLDSGEWMVEVDERQLSTMVQLHPFYDAAGHRARS